MSDQNQAQKIPQPPDQKAKVVTDGGEHGVVSIATSVVEVIALHTMLVFEMPDHRLDGAATTHLAFDLRSDAALLF